MFEILMHRLSLILVTISFITIGYWALEGPPLKDIEGTVITKEVKRGGTLKVSFTSKKTKSCPVMTQHSLISSKGIVWSVAGPAANWNSRIGETISVTYKIKVPEDIALGETTYQEAITYTCNPLKDHLVYTPILVFNVVE